ncbi:MAG: hypothetical protein ACI9OJ_002909 [Myxococcota bacterium]|jgi:hypothetical protein
MSEKNEGTVSKAQLGLVIGVGVAIAAAGVIYQVMTEPKPVDPPTTAAVEPAVPTAVPPVEPGLVLPTEPQKEWSNVGAEDYVGPKACAECHEENYNHWRGHPHRVMNATASSETVKGDFSGRHFKYLGFRSGKRNDVPPGLARFTRDGAKFFMSIFTPDGETFIRKFRVTRTVGSRLEQMYMGLQVEGPEAKTHTVYTHEHRMPFGYMLSRERWFTVPYFDDGYTVDSSQQKPRPPESTPQLDSWTMCMDCHNTFPYEKRVFAPAPFLTGYPRGHLSGELTKTVDHKQVLNPDKLVTLGISCESCHFGGREHAKLEKTIRFVPSAAKGGLRVTSKALTGWTGKEQENPYVVNSLCSQCHGRPRATYPGGGVFANSSESFDMGTSCGGQLKCTDCHNPHIAGPAKGGGGPDDPKHLATCETCHADYATPEGAAAHSKHPGTAGVSCMDCHMPRMVGGLELMTRTHRVTSPTVYAAYQSGTPNACNLCHVDKSLSWTLNALDKTFGVKVGPPGESDTAAKEVWLRHPRSVVRLASAHGVARSPFAREGAMAYLLPLLRDPYPRRRYFAQTAIEIFLGRKLTVEEFDVGGAAASREAQVQALAKTHGVTLPKAPAEILVDPTLLPDEPID